MQLEPISLPDWKAPPIGECTGRPDWFEPLFGSDGDGGFLPGPTGPRARAQAGPEDN